jgi:hypothetical protein
MRDFQQPSRSPAISGEAMAATSHPLATLAALDVLRAGGNAVDAALAAAAVLCVAEPQMTGLGGDCFVLYSPKAGLPKALNGSGRAPEKATAAWFAERGIKTIDARSPHAVTVPGAVDAWLRLHADYGTKDLAELFLPAINWAEQGGSNNSARGFRFQLRASDGKIRSRRGENLRAGRYHSRHRRPVAPAGARRDLEAHRARRPQGASTRARSPPTWSESSTRWAVFMHDRGFRRAAPCDYVEPISAQLSRLRGLRMSAERPGRGGAADAARAYRRL